MLCKVNKKIRFFLVLCSLISISFSSPCFYFFLNFRGLLKYQTNLDTHPPGCINLNGTRYQNIHLPAYLSEHFHESFPGGFSKPDELTQNTFVKICMEEPRFQANFPQVRLILCLYWSLQSPCFHNNWSTLYLDMFLKVMKQLFLQKRMFQDVSIASYYLLFHYRQPTAQRERPTILQNIENPCLTDHMIFAYCGTGTCHKKGSKDIFLMHWEK